MSDIFINNKYTRWYYNIITNVQSRTLQFDVYTEKHHIIPKSLGGSNDKSNLVKLLPKEHFACHRLLTKMTEGDARRKMCYAFWILTNRANHSVSSSAYSQAKLLIQEQMRTRVITDEFREKCRSNQLGKKISDATRQALLKSNLGRKKTNEEIEKIRNSVKNHYSTNANIRKGKKRTEEQKAKISEGKRLSWKLNPLQGTTGKRLPRDIT